MAIDPESLLASLAAIIGLGYLGSLLFEKTRIPDVLLLIGLGVVLGQTGLLDRAVFTAIVQPVGIFTLLIILFDGGLSLKLRDLFHGLARAGLLAVLGWVLTVAAVGGALSALYQWDLLTGLLLGAILGGSSSIVVIPLVARAGASDDTRVALSVESALTDVLCVVGTLTIIGIIGAGTLDPQAAVQDVAARFSVAILFGVGAGLAWSVFWRVLEQGSYAYMITLAAILALHLGVEALGGTGPIAVLAFGIMLGNRVKLLKGKASQAWEPGGAMRRFQEEITFFIRAFFFAFLGLILDLDTISSSRFVLGSLVILLAIAATRYLAVRIATIGASKMDGDENLIWSMMPRGLAAAALASIPAEAGIVGTEDFVGYAFALIVLTNVVVTVGMFLFSGEGDGEDEADEPEPSSE